MKDLENFIKNNKSSFERLEPKRSWNDIQQNLSTHETKNRFILSRSFILKIAASFLFLVLASTYFIQNTNSSTVLFADVNMMSPKGSFIPLDPSKNKVTLVQFWESGNVVCSDENCYYYLPAYEKYKNKGFEIYAISLDEKKESWLNGIEENNLPWIHVSDLQGWASPLCVECNISKTPTSFLLNNKGEIIQKDIVAEDLENILSKLLVSE